MSIGQLLAEFCSRFRLFNPHRVHGFVSGPGRSHFWLDLGWAYKDLRGFYSGHLRDPARATAADIFGYLYNLQFYNILRTATYMRFNGAVTVGDQLTRACEHVSSELAKPQYIHQNREFQTECESLMLSATNLAADAVMKRFEKSLSEELKSARWASSYGHD